MPGGFVAGEGEALVGDLLALDEQLLEGELGRGGLVLEELVELLLALAVRAGVLGVARVVLDELLDVLEAGVEGDLLALGEQLAVVLLLLDDQRVNVIVEEPLALALVKVLRALVVPGR